MVPLSRTPLVAAAAALLVLLCGPAAEAQDLVVNGKTITLGGVRSYNQVIVKNGGRVVVPKYNGKDRINTGNLQLRANYIFVDSASSIVADGAGYQPRLCDNGGGPNATAGGRGGCSVKDSGGGGAHFGRGGRGTKDCKSWGCTFPQHWEEDCGYRSGNSCKWTSGSCRNNDAKPSVSGVQYVHSIYKVEFGAAGGDKGCLDGDGWYYSMGGAGGGRWRALLGAN